MWQKKKGTWKTKATQTKVKGTFVIEANHLY